MNLTIVYDETDDMGIIAIVNNVTSQVLLDQELSLYKDNLEGRVRERTLELEISEERLIRQFQTSPVPTLIIEQRKEREIIEDYNKAFSDLTNGEIKLWWNEMAVEFFADNAEICADISFLLHHDVSIDRESWMQIPGTDNPRLYRIQLNSIDEKRGMIHVEDITELTNKEEAISLFFYTSIDMVAIANFEGYLTKLNPRWTEVLGWTIEELTSKPFIEFVHEDDREATIAAAGELYEGDNVVNFQNRYQTKDGDYVWLSWNAAVDVKQKVLISVARDVTAQKEFESALTQAKLEAEQANRAKSEFLANMSHEIRTPLNAVIGFSELLTGMIHDPIQKRYIESINTSGKSLLTLINDILDLSKIEAGMLELEPSVVNIRDLLGEVGRIFEQKVSETRLDYIQNIDDQVPEFIEVDEVRLRQVLVNVIGNALKFTERGSVSVHVHTRSEGRQTHLYIDVEDTGIGIHQEEITQIFESFKQQSGQSTRKFGGTGLGLSICKRLLQMMDGDIQVKSIVNRGSTFTIHLNDVPIIQKDVESDSGSTAQWLDEHFENKKILIVDDDRTNRYLLQEILKQLDCVIELADNGQEAVVKAKKTQPDLIIMDIRMPVMGGVEATQIIKKMPDTADIPIIAFTASAAFTSPSDYRSLRFDGCIYKPVKPQELIKELRRFLIPKTATLKESIE